MLNFSKKSFIILLLPISLVFLAMSFVQKDTCHQEDQCNYERQLAQEASPSNLKFDDFSFMKANLGSSKSSRLLTVGLVLLTIAIFGFLLKVNLVVYLLSLSSLLLPYQFALFSCFALTVLSVLFLVIALIIRFKFVGRIANFNFLYISKKDALTFILLSSFCSFLIIYVTSIQSTLAVLSFTIISISILSLSLTLTSACVFLTSQNQGVKLYFFPFKWSEIPSSEASKVFRNGKNFYRLDGRSFLSLD